MRQIVLDTETTGLSVAEGHRIIEIGAVELINRRMTDHSCHFYINPERNIDEQAKKIHGLSRAMLADKPPFATIAEDFFAYINGAELIIHNAPFDVGFINAEFSRYHAKPFSLGDHCRIVDVLLLARQHHPGQRNNLDALCKRYHIDNSHREFHGALLDAQLLAHVYLAMTGGQGNLFEEFTDDNISSTDEQYAISDVESTQSPHQKSYKIIYANATELAAHNDWIKRLKK